MKSERAQIPTHSILFYGIILWYTHRPTQEVWGIARIQYVLYRIQAQLAAMVLTKLFNMIQAWRQMERAGPELLKRATANRDRALELAQQRAKEREESMNHLSDVLEKQLDGAEKQTEAALEMRQKAFKIALEKVQVDETAVRNRAVTSLLDNWEQNLAKGDPKKD